jgi:hypothetical protein
VAEPAEAVNVAKAAAMSHADLMEEIRDMCTEFGLLVNHFPDSRGSWTPGQPDLTIAGPGGVLLVECKTMFDSLRPDQRLWAAMLLKTRHYQCWKPTDLLSGVVRRELAVLAGFIERVTE